MTDEWKVGDVAVISGLLATQLSAPWVGKPVILKAEHAGGHRPSLWVALDPASGFTGAFFETELERP
jgi:hypothetical protein